MGPGGGRSGRRSGPCGPIHQSSGLVHWTLTVVPGGERGSEGGGGRGET